MPAKAPGKPVPNGKRGSPFDAKPPASPGDRFAKNAVRNDGRMIGWPCGAIADGAGTDCPGAIGIDSFDGRNGGVETLPVSTGLKLNSLDKVWPKLFLPSNDSQKHSAANFPTARPAIEHRNFHRVICAHGVVQNLPELINQFQRSNRRLRSTW